MKLCCDCRQVLPAEAFHRRGRALQSACKACKSLRDRERCLHPGKLRQGTSRKWKAANPGALAEYHAARRRAQSRRPAWVRPASMRPIYRLARALRELGHDVVVDHVVPLKAQQACGLHSPDNLRLAFRTCNGRKWNRMPTEEPPAISRVRSIPTALLRKC